MSNTKLYIDVANTLLREAGESERTDVADRAIAAAQVNATLALVEQQRIANLIAYKQLHTGRTLVEATPGRWSVEDLDVSADNLTDEIEAGLDMDDAS